jgi:hypothetical protein
MLVRETLARYDFFDQEIVEHGFTRYNRDYRVVAEMYGEAGAGRPIQHLTTYTFLFRGCVEADYVSVVPPGGFSMDDVFIDYDRWVTAGTPDGFVWGVNSATAYPGLHYVEDSSRAAAWANRLRLSMHEVAIKTNTYVLTLVFHDVTVVDSPALPKISTTPD